MNIRLTTALLLILLGADAAAWARPTPLGTAITYQGQLKQSGSPVSGAADFQFTLFDVPAGGSPVSSMLSQTLTLTSGLFTAELDFGAGMFGGNERWLDIAVRYPSGSGSFIPLSPRQRLNAAPYSLYALNAMISGTQGGAVNFTNAANTYAGNGAGLTNLPAANLVGTANPGLLSGTYSNPLNFSNAGNTYTGNGAGLTNLNASNLTTGTLGSGLLSGAYGNALTLSNASNIFNGLFSGSGASLTSLNASNIASGNLNILRLPTGGSWSLSSDLNINANALFVDQSSGGVGIGTATPTFALDVLRTTASNSINPLAIFRAAGTGSSAGAIRVQNSANNYFNLGITPANDFALGYNANISLAGDLLRITPAGNVGLGTITPVNRLDVEGGAAIGATYAGTNAAPANGLIVQGNVGIGTTAPAESLHVAGDIRADGAQGLYATNPGDANARVELGWSSNIAHIRVGGAGAGVFNGLDIVGSAGTAIFSVLDTGQVGIGTDFPIYKLEVIDSAGPAMHVQNNGTSETMVVNNAGTGPAATFESGNVRIMDGSVGVGILSPAFLLHCNGTAGKPGGGSWSVASDARLKTAIRPIDGALDQMLSLTGVTYEYRDPDAIHELPGRQMGMIAQEVERSFPQWVDEAADGYKRVTYRGFEALTVEALRDLRAEKDTEIAQLRAEKDSQITELRDRVARLEQMISTIVEHKELH